MSDTLIGVSPKLAHLGMIQRAVQTYEWHMMGMRAAAALTMGGLAYAHLTSPAAGVLALLSILVGLMFVLLWWLDGHYHHSKRAYIALFDRVRQADGGDADFDMSIDKIKTEEGLGKAMFTGPAVVFYPTLVIATVLLSMMVSRN